MRPMRDATLCAGAGLPTLVGEALKILVTTKIRFGGQTAARSTNAHQHAPRAPDPISCLRRCSTRRPLSSPDCTTRLGNASPSA